MGAYSKITNAFKKYPLLRGMASYSIIWPGSSLIQQTFEGKTFDNYDWWRCARYGLYGSCYVAPTLYSWLTIANIMWPGSSIRAGIIKTFVETITYTPFAMCSFYFGMSLLESKPFNEAVAEVEAKFLPTYKVGASVWPAVAMVNFCLIPPRNRVPFISCCSLIWTCFLAYMKHLEKEQVNVKTGANPIKIIKANL
ncbi:mpv17-like protein [Helicoverpa armigera]|uniref:mpv17-like protein n=1 Tax=Helicoverpa armigera TaxID=29058 RepID=UPI000B36B57F|nr:mpv17-like protein [Helicoverpa armigera]XP_047021699.1 mpv17-like protein [Helicoverpa zea]